jgi:hypothetical protein
MHVCYPFRSDLRPKHDHFGVKMNPASMYWNEFCAHEKDERGSTPSMRSDRISRKFQERHQS